MKKGRLSLEVAALLLLAVATVLFARQEGGNYALAELSVEGLTCGSCVQKVEQTLKGVAGAGKVDVSVTAGLARVEYDPERTDAGRIAAVITAAGYPAAIERTLSVADYRAFREDAGRLSSAYVGRIGERLIGRDEFEAEVARCRALLPAGHADFSEASLRRFAWDGLVQREILLAEAGRRGIVVQEGEVALEIERMRRESEDFEALSEQFGGEGNLSRRVKEDVVIDRLLQEERKRVGEGPEQEAALARWYRGLSGAATVEILDPALRATVEGKGCASGCCG